MISDYPFGSLKLFSQIAMVKLMDNRSLQLIFGGVGYLFSFVSPRPVSGVHIVSSVFDSFILDDCPF